MYIYIYKSGGFCGLYKWAIIFVIFEIEEDFEFFDGFMSDEFFDGIFGEVLAEFDIKIEGGDFEIRQ